MLKIILLCLVVFFSVYLFGGELVPLRQYDKLEQRVTMIPDHYLFEVVGELLALGFFDDNDKVFFNNFHKCDLIVIAPLFFMKGDEYEQVCAARAGKSSAD